MAEWFLIAMLGAKMTMLGPFTEADCQLVKRVVFAGSGAVCIDRRLIDAKSPA